jgi:putative membrane protein
VPSFPARESVAGNGAPLPVPPGRPSALQRLLGYVALAIKLGLFALVFVLAVKNSEPVTLRFFLGREVETSLALALVAALCAGAFFGVLAMAGYAFRLRRDGSRARAEAVALRHERDDLCVERDRLRGELAVLAPAAPATADTALPTAGGTAAVRPVPHGL